MLNFAVLHKLHRLFFKHNCTIK